MYFPFLFFAHWFWSEGFFLPWGKVYQFICRILAFRSLLSMDCVCFFLFPPSLLDIMLLIAIHRCISWVLGEFDLYLPVVIPRR